MPSPRAAGDARRAVRGIGIGRREGERKGSNMDTTRTRSVPATPSRAMEIIALVIGVLMLLGAGLIAG